MTIQNTRNIHHKFHKVRDIINEVGATSSRNEKEEILERNIDNKLLKRTMYYTYNDDYVYNVSDRTMELVFSMIETQRLMTMPLSRNIFELLDYLNENNLSNDTVEEIALFMQGAPNSLHDLYSSMILKNLRIGASVKTINKVWVGLIPTFELMRAHKLDGNEHLLKDREFGVTLKLDGVRASALINKDGSIELRTRQNKLIEGLLDIEKELKDLPKGYMYDGELLCTDDVMKSTNELYRKTAGIINNKDEEKDNIHFHIFDMVDLDEFLVGECKVIYEDRRKELSDIEESDHIHIVPMLYSGDDKERLDKITKDLVNQGLEGTMINFLDGVYECKRSRQILKVKPTYTLDLEVVRVEQGKPNGKYKDSLGALVVDYKGNEVGVGTGFSDKDRDTLWEMRDELIGKIVEIEHKGETAKKDTDELSLNYATFIQLREDKDEPSLD